MRIIFIRHGDASSDSRFQDNERPLTDLGRRQATYVGNFLQHTKTHVNIILTSPFKRTCETGEIVQSIIHAPSIETTEYLVNGANPKQLFKQLAELDVETVILVGHEPFLSDTISLIIGGNNKTDIEIKKCSLAFVEVHEPIRSGNGALKQLINVETLSKML